MTPDLFDYVPKFGSDFDGASFEPKRDGKRLNAQLQSVFRILSDGQWRTLAELSEMTGAPEASVSARCRDLRKNKFGSFNVERRFVRRGLWQYRLLSA